MDGAAAAHAERAAATFAAMQRAWYREDGLYRRGGRWWARTATTLWPLANAWDATCALVAAPGSPRPAPRTVLESRVRAALRYAPSAERRRGDGPLGLASGVQWLVWSRIERLLGRTATAYHDDNEWVALALLHQHRLTGDGGCLALARRLFGFVVAGWCDDPAWAHPGGIRWADAAWSTGRNTCANGPAAALGAELYLLTGDRPPLEWAVRIHDWARSSLRRPDGLYVDQLRPDGGVEPTIWSYNQGSMIGAGVLLAEATGEGAFLEDASATAAASLVHYRGPDALLSEPAAFVAVYLRNLFLLDTVRPDPRYRELAEAFAAAAWEQRRDPVTGLFGPAPRGLNETAPIVAIEALLAGSPPRP